MNRDQCSEQEAQELIDCMVELVNEGEDPEEVLFDEGFEPDYVFEILNY